MSNMHLLAYTIASAGGLTNQDVPGMTDTFASLQNNHYILQNDWLVKWMYGLGANLTQMRLNTPYLRQFSQSYAGVVDASATVTSLPAVAWMWAQLPKIKAIDETAVEMTDTAGAGQLFGLLGICRQVQNTVPPGPMFTVLATASITLGNKVWGAGTFAFQAALPAGRYSVVGMDVEGANLVAARLIFPDGGPRPGVVARNAFTNKPDPLFKGGQLGEFGQFESTAQPLIELLGTAAPTTQSIWLDLVQVRAGA